MVQASDDTFYASLEKTHAAKSAAYIQKRSLSAAYREKDRRCFGVRHYAGDVVYDVVRIALFYSCVHALHCVSAALVGFVILAASPKMRGVCHATIGPKSAATRCADRFR